MAVTVDEIQSEVVVEGRGGSGATGGTQASPETRRAELRAIVRELLREELARFLRTEARR